jgi:4-carboxymuconolactone decarboxylase
MRSAIDSGTTGAALTALSMDFVFGQVWSRDGLQPSQRSLVTMAVLLALRQTAELKNHIRIGLTNGLTPQEVEEAFIQAAAYAGFPAARVATDLLGEILRESDRSFDGDAHERR